MHAPSAVRAPHKANLHPNSQYMTPAAAKQTSVVHWTICKPMASHITAYEPPLWHMGPTAPKLAVRRLYGAGTKSEAPRQVRVASYGLEHELSCARRLAVGAVTEGRRSSTYRFRLRSQEGFEQKSPP
eukprot:7170696-Prymnesium_polylepis.1